MLAGLSLFYADAVLCLNGLWLLGRIDDKEIAIIDIFVGGITLKCVLASRQLGRGSTIPGRAVLKVLTGMRFRSACRGFSSEC